MLASLADEEGRKRLLALLLIPIVLVLLIIASPMAIFFSVLGSGSADTTGEYQPITGTIRELQAAFDARIQDAATGTGAEDRSSIVYLGSEENAPIRNGQDVLAVFAVRAGMGSEKPEAVAQLSDAQRQLLQDTFWDMNQIEVEENAVAGRIEQSNDDTASDDNVDRTKAKSTRRILVDSKSYDEMIPIYDFTEEQQHVLEELMNPKYATLFIDVADKSIATSPLSPTEIAAIRANLPQGLSPSRQAIVTAALSLVGKVSYFWGGKSTVLGWDDRWGESREVTASGSPSTGKTRAFGLDCSGFVAYAFVNGGIPADAIEEAVGMSSSAQWKTSYPIAMEQAIPGDLAFLAIPGTRKVNHVGIVAGYEDDGSLLIVHCASSQNGVVVTPIGEVFRYFRRPAVFGDKE